MSISKSDLRQQVSVGDVIATEAERDALQQSSYQ